MSYYYYSNGHDSGNRGSGFLAGVPRVTRTLIIINLFVYIATLVNGDLVTRWFALYYPASQLFRFWQPVTYMFVHGGFWHILFNMYTLFIFGSVVERMIGERKYLLFYMICGLGAAACHMGVQAIEAYQYSGGIAMGSQAAVQNYAMLKMIPTVGASGAIYGLLLAYAMLFPESRLTLLFPPVTLSAKWMVIIFAGIELLTGVTGTRMGIAHFAHLGGMIFGFGLIKYWKAKGTLFDRKNL